MAHRLTSVGHFHLAPEKENRNGEKGIWEGRQEGQKGWSLPEAHRVEGYGRFRYEAGREKVMRSYAKTDAVARKIRKGPKVVKVAKASKGLRGQMKQIGKKGL